MNSVNFPAVNFYRFRKIAQDAVLVTLDSGEWQILSEEQFSDLKKENFEDKQFLNLLKDNHIYLTEDNWSTFQENIKKRWTGVFAPPTLHIVVVTPQCNLRCIYCHAALAQNDGCAMDITTADKVLDQIFAVNTNSLTIELQGGEPVLNFDIVKHIVCEAEKRAVQTSKSVELCIVTNFTDVLTDDKIRFLIEHGVDVSTSLDGPREVHENNRNRNYANGFSFFTERVAAFRRIWSELRDDPPRLSAMVTTTKGLLNKPEETVNTYVDLGFSDLFVRPVNPLGRGENKLSDFEYEPEAFVDFWGKLIDVLIARWKQGIHITEGHLDIILKKLFFYENGYMDLRFPCGAAFGQRAYGADGKIYTCDEGRMLKEQNFCIGSVTDSPAAIIKNPNGINTFLSSLSELSACEFCAYKPFCGTCPILNWKEHPDRNTQTYGGRRCKIYQGMLDYVFTKFMNSSDAQEVFGEMLLNGLENGNDADKL